MRVVVDNDSPTDESAHLEALRQQGCIVVDARIGMLVNVPRYAAAQSYRFSRADARGVVTPLGDVTALEVRELAGDAR